MITGIIVRGRDERFLLLKDTHTHMRTQQDKVKVEKKNRIAFKNIPPHNKKDGYPAFEL